MNQTARNRFIKHNSHLFWYIKKDKLDEISDQLLVETILNYGDWNSVQKLIRILSLEKVANIFYNLISKKRNNFKPTTLNYFKLYFNEHLQKRNTLKKSNRSASDYKKV